MGSGRASLFWPGGACPAQTFPFPLAADLNCCVKGPGRNRKEDGTCCDKALHSAAEGSFWGSHQLAPGPSSEQAVN